MLEEQVKQFVGKTIESVRVEPLGPVNPVPFAVFVQFTDKSQMRVTARDITGSFETALTPRGFLFPG